MGKEAEDKIGQALDLLKSQWGEVVEFHHSKQTGEIDSLAVDFLVFLRSKLVFPLQVKSSHRGVKDHISKHPHIIAVQARRKDSAARLAKLIKKLILRRYQKIKLYPLPV